ncbi:4-amino-4-deoxy-L-arabinose transferase-like glycosyltransferase [Kitasatospora sp. MAP12-15]|uniref:glycosyltransferase family 39 protein n=1 Tax=unclassified Kitasatospora TaxID=2633591 RepID=UPI0024756847|nr:glycosyltransferase family 39 protein [Kitasatospora sp. MAP12-44]MDH6114957.1 4-amino-4-deoxy-L-arabinose transferase-like glycosyltransferase [Kitasatospora sp. MAP12-44]
MTAVLPIEAPVVEEPDGGLRAALARVAAGHRWAAVRTRVPLFCLLVLQAVLSWRLSNSAFQDESLYLYAGHREIAQLLHHTPTFDNYSSYFSGAPFLYPVLGALADSFAGLGGARALSLFFMLATTGLLHALTRRLFGRPAALPAAAVFAVTGPTLFLGHLATYDAMALFLLALASWTAVRTVRLPALTAALAGPPLVLAALTKYAALLYAPTVIALAVLAAIPERGRNRAVQRGLLVVVAALGCGYGLVSLAGRAFMVGLKSTTTARAVGTDGTGLLVRSSVEYGGAVFVLAIAGAVLLVRAHAARTGERGGGRPGRLALGLLLTGTALLAPAYQIHLHTLTSLHKHVGYGLFFASPMAGYAISRLLGSRLHDPRRLGLALGICLVVAGLGISQSAALFQQWPDATGLVQVLRTQVRPTTGRYLVEESEVPRYYLRDLVQPYQWSGTYYFEYTDKKGQHYTGVPAYKAAIADRYFDLIVLRYGPTAALDRQIDGDLTAGKGYQLIAKVAADSSYGAGTWFVWRADAG